MDPFSLKLWPKSPSGLDEHIIDDVSIDSRTIKGNRALFVALMGKNGDGHAHVAKALENGARYALVSKEWQKPDSVSESALIRSENTLLSLQSLARTVRQLRAEKAQVIAIAGSIGKTTVKNMLCHIFAGEDGVYFSPESYNSQIGVALSLINIPSGTKLAFIEMAATKPGEMSRLITMSQPTCTIITNFFRPKYGAADRQHEMESFLFELIATEDRQEWIVAERHDRLLNRTKNICFWNDTALATDAPKTPFMAENRKIVLAAANLLQRYTKIDLETAAAKLNEYLPQPMRTELWKDSFGLTCINGTYSHETLSFAASLEEITSLTDNKGGKRALIFGGLQESLFDPKQKARIIEAIRAAAISHLFLWPKSSEQFIDRQLAQKYNILVESCDSLADAIDRAIIHHRQSKSTTIPFDSIIFKAKEKAPIEQLIHLIENSPSQTYLSINLAAIQHNIDTLRKKLSPATRIMIMVKALAYGTDDVRVAHFLKKCGIEILGVSYVDEGIGLRAESVSSDIFVVNAGSEEMEKAAQWNLEVGVGSIEQISAAADAAARQKQADPDYKMKVHLHVDTGMKRFGCKPEEAIALGQMIHKNRGLLVFEGLFTHFCSSENPKEDHYTRSQISELEAIVQGLQHLGIAPCHIHAANSAAAVRFELPKCSMARIGLATYGIHSSESTRSALPNLRPALSLVTKIVGLNHAKRGDTVSYNRSHTIQNDSALIAVLPIGYYDGIHRCYSEKGEVFVRGQKAPMIGKICMDYMMIDVTHIPGAHIGDSVVIFGEDEMGNISPIENFAEQGGSIAHELMTCLGPRIRRFFIYDESLSTR